MGEPRRGEETLTRAIDNTCLPPEPRRREFPFGAQVLCCFSDSATLEVSPLRFNLLSIKKCAIERERETMLPQKRLRESARRPGAPTASGDGAGGACVSPPARAVPWCMRSALRRVTPMERRCSWLRTEFRQSRGVSAARFIVAERAYVSSDNQSPAQRTREKRRFTGRKPSF